MNDDEQNDQEQEQEQEDTSTAGGVEEALSGAGIFEEGD